MDEGSKRSKEVEKRWRRGREEVEKRWSIADGLFHLSLSLPIPSGSWATSVSLVPSLTNPSRRLLGHGTTT